MQQSTTAPPQAHSHANTDTNAQWDEKVIYRPELSQKKKQLTVNYSQKTIKQKNFSHEISFYGAYASNWNNYI